MSDQGDEVESSVTRDGITVYQTYQAERFGVPAVVLKFVSEREEPASVRATVDLLPDLGIEEVGFHPEYGRENWTVDSDRLEFAAEIGPGEEVTTMYAVDSLATGQLDSLLDNLSIEQVDVDTPESEFDTQPESQPGHSTSTVPAEDVTAEDLRTKAEADPAADDRHKSAADDGAFGDSALEPTAEASDDVGAVGAMDQGKSEHEEEREHQEEREHEEERKEADISEQESEDEASESGGGGDSDEESKAWTTSEGAGEEETFGEESEEDEQSAAIRATPELSEVSTATLFHELQSRMSDLEANVEEIEEFDTRHGRPADAFAELRDELATLGERVDAIDGDVSTNATTVEELSERLDDAEDDIDSLAEGQDALASKVSTLREWRNQVKSTLGALGE